MRAPIEVIGEGLPIVARRRRKAIDFGTGHYYSLRGRAETVWSTVVAGASAAEVAAALQGRFDADDAEVGPAVEVFLTSLVDEGLVVVDNGSEGAAPASEATSGARDEPLGELAFEKFTDMAEIILLDPVHDVSEKGWPSASSGDAGRTV